MGTKIDLTSDEPKLPIRIALVARCSPGSAGAPEACSELADTLSTEFGLEVDVIRLVRPAEAAATGPPVAMEVNPEWDMAAEMAAARINECDLLVLELNPASPFAFISDLMGLTTVPELVVLDGITPSDLASADDLVAAARKSKAAVTRSSAASDWLLGETGGEVRADVIPHGSAWQPLGVPDRVRRTILSWGYLHPEMGFERVVRALPHLADLDPDARYRMVGVAHPAWSPTEAAAYRDTLSELAQTLGVADQIEFGPTLHSADELLAEIESCDVVAVPYDAVDQMSSRIATEAVAAGRPVVATRFPGAVDLLVDGAGIVVGHDDPDEMATALRKLLTDDEAYQQAAAAAAAKSPMLKWRAIGTRFIDQFVRLLAVTSVESSAES